MLPFALRFSAAEGKGDRAVILLAFVAAVLANEPDPKLARLRSHLAESRQRIAKDVGAGGGQQYAIPIRNQIQNANMVWSVCLSFEIERLKLVERSGAVITAKAFPACEQDREEVKAWLRLGMRAMNRLDQEPYLDRHMAILESMQRKGIQTNLRKFPPK